MTGLICGAIVLYLIKFVGAPWWLYCALIPAMILDILVAVYDTGKEHGNGKNRE